MLKERQCRILKAGSRNRTQLSRQTFVLFVQACSIFRTLDPSHVNYAVTRAHPPVCRIGNTRLRIARSEKYWSVTKFAFLDLETKSIVTRSKEKKGTRMKFKKQNAEDHAAKVCDPQNALKIVGLKNWFLTACMNFRWVMDPFSVQNAVTTNYFSRRHSWDQLMKAKLSFTSVPNARTSISLFLLILHFIPS